MPAASRDHSRWLRGGLLCVIVASCVTAASSGGGRELPPPFPDFRRLDLRQFEPSVREQIEQAFQAARANPRDPQASGRLGMVLQAYDLSGAALACYQRARALAPDEFSWAYLLATVQGALGEDASKVAESYAVALRLNPGSAPAGIKRAESLLAAGRVDESRALAERLTAEQPRSARVQYVAGRILAAAGDWNGAAERYREACGLAPYYGAAHYALSGVLRRLGDSRGAEQHLAAFRGNELAAPPLDDPLLNDVAKLQTGGDYHLNEGKRLQDAGQSGPALDEYRAALKANPRLVQAHVNLISLYGALGQYREAEAHYRSALEVDAGQAEAYYNYGIALGEQGRFHEAEAEFRKALAIDPGGADALNNLGYALERQGQSAEAERCYREAVRNHSNHREARFNLARMLEKRRDYAAAIEQLLNTLAPEDDRTPAFMYYLADAYARTAQYDKAVQYGEGAKARAASRGQTELAAAADQKLRALASVREGTGKP